MNFRHILATGAVMLSLATGSAFAQDKAAKQAEILKTTQATLEKFYKAEPKLKAAVGGAPGYAVFTTYGISFIIGGAGGKGVAHDNKTKQNVFMSLASASVGAQISATESDVLIVFKTAAALSDFINKGWTAEGGANVAAGAGGKSAGAGVGSTAVNNADSYTLTKNGLVAGVAIAGTKVWKDGDLN